MRLIIGLGNPGTKYADTRHNLGYRVADRLAKRRGGYWQTDKATKAAVSAVSGFVLAKPTTFMNESGRSVRALMERHGATPADLMIICDDFNLPFGEIRYRSGGSAGGQKGLDDIIKAAGTEDVPRLRIGIGPPTTAADEYVLSSFSPGEKERLPDIIDQSVDWLEEHLDG